MIENLGFDKHSLYHINSSHQEDLKTAVDAGCQLEMYEVRLLVLDGTQSV